MRCIYIYLQTWDDVPNGIASPIQRWPRIESIMQLALCVFFPPCLVALPVLTILPVDALDLYLYMYIYIYIYIHRVYIQYSFYANQEQLLANIQFLLTNIPRLALKLFRFQKCLILTILKTKIDMGTCPLRDVLLIKKYVSSHGYVDRQRVSS